MRSRWRLLMQEQGVSRERAEPDNADPHLPGTRIRAILVRDLRRRPRQGPRRRHDPQISPTSPRHPITTSQGKYG